MCRPTELPSRATCGRAWRAAREALQGTAPLNTVRDVANYQDATCFEDAACFIAGSRQAEAVEPHLPFGRDACSTAWGQTRCDFKARFTSGRALLPGSRIVARLIASLTTLRVMDTLVCLALAFRHQRIAAIKKIPESRAERSYCRGRLSLASVSHSRAGLRGTSTSLFLIVGLGSPLRDPYRFA